MLPQALRRRAEPDRVTMRGVESRRIVLAGYYPPPSGGESRHVHTLAHRLRAEGMDVDVLNARRGAGPSPEYRHVTSPLNFLHTVLALLGKESLLHLHTNGHNAKSWLMILAASAALRVRQARGILTLHSGLAPSYLASCRAPTRLAIRMSLMPFSHIICVNPNIRDALRAVGVRRVPLSVMPAFLGVPDPPLISVADSLLLDRFSPIVVGTAGRGPEYGLPLLLEAVARLRGKFPRLGCVITGEGASDPFRALIDTFLLSDSVVVLGDVPYERHLAILARADLFVRSTYADGDAISVREALALHVPVVASNVGTRPDGVTLFRSGDVHDLCDKMRAALGSSTPATSCGGSIDPLADLLAIYRRA